MTESAIIVGGGISGLTTAYRLAESMPVLVLEAADGLGGCLAGSTLSGQFPLGVDTGAEASLYRRSETSELAAELGFELHHPSAEHSSQIYARSRLHPIPKRTVMGVPGDPADLLELLGPAAVARIGAEEIGPALGDADVSLGDFLEARFGAELVDTLVDPLLGGVYAGRCRDLSLAATVPALLPAAQKGTSVLELVSHLLAVRDAAATHGSAQPVFMSLTGGINQLVPALRDGIEARGGRVLTATRATEIARITGTAQEPGIAEAVGAIQPVTASAGHRLTSGSGDHRDRVSAGEDLRWTVRTATDEFAATHLVLATPAHRSAGLLSDLTPEVGAALARIPYASTALVLALVDLDGAGPMLDGAEPDGSTPETSELDGSGFLVPPTEEAFIKASTFVSNKWPWVGEALPEGTALIRMSVGRFGDAPHTWQDLSDDELVDRAFADWLHITGRSDSLRTAEVHRWPSALPQYLPGQHVRQVEIDETLLGLPGLHLAGSAYEGVGIPACISRANTVASRILEEDGAGTRLTGDSHT